MKNTETPVKILILKQIYTETSEPSLEALSQGVSGVFEHPVLHMHTGNVRFVRPIDCNSTGIYLAPIFHTES